MTRSTRPWLLALLALAATPVTAPALAQQAADDPFSVVQRRPVAPEETIVEIPVYAPAGAFLSREDYLAARGGTAERVLRTRWRIERFDLDGTEQSDETREVVIGDGYVTEATDPGAAVIDFNQERILTRVATPTGPVMRNRPVIGYVHRQMDTFTFYTRGGELDEVTGPDGSRFERFWIEAAMGVRLAEVPMQLTTTDAGAQEIRRNPDGAVILGVTPGEDGSPADVELFRRWLRHTTPIHPDALNIMSTLTGIPERFGFIVFSPSSPDGRREVWSRLSAGESTARFPWPENLPAAPAADYEWSDPELASLAHAGLNAAAHPGGSPDEAVFLDAAQAAASAGDKPGALLMLYQASHHLGACPARSTEPLCMRISQLVAAGLGDEQFEGLMATLAALQGDRAAALESLRPYLDRGDLAGAAANLLAAETLAALRTSDAAHAPELDPLSLFAASAQADPHCALTYWHAGRYAASQADVESAWMLFDIAVSVPAAATTPPVREAAVMNAQLQAIAPNYFRPPPAPVEAVVEVPVDAAVGAPVEEPVEASDETPATDPAGTEAETEPPTDTD
ncbi:hypothetical protein [Maricaulis salignorans]|uniref:Tetratricopeptide repeat-containing protein n=1 Tax=Maricaulis salignorans TaxID=144026 RepID=A0A1G9RXQ4_9PROT|nr:hypothetical protein [Maricaulis salignorans]SDM27790.1 hypothetical protein SAMN04488568_10824 [Maricaulis salignorans]